MVNAGRREEHMSGKVENEDRCRLARGVRRASSLILQGFTPDNCKEFVQELLDLLVPLDESGRCSVWKLDSSTGAYRIFATAGRGKIEEESSLELDDELDLQNLAFLRSLSQRGGNSDGLFRSKKDMDDRAVPNKPNYDQVMFSSCMHRGIMVAVLGVGRRFSHNSNENNINDNIGLEVTDGESWKVEHLTVVHAIADLLRMPFLNLQTEINEENSQAEADKEDEYYESILNAPQKSSIPEYWLHDYYSQLSEIIGATTQKLDSFGLLGLSMWQYNDGDLLLEPGRRTRRSKREKFTETSVDTCETIRKDVRKIIYPLAHISLFLELDWGDGEGGEYEEHDDMSQLREWVTQEMHYHNLPQSVRRRSYLGTETPIKVSREFAKRIGCLDDESNNVRRIILMPVQVRGSLRAVLSFTLDDCTNSEEIRAAVLRYGMQARKSLLALYWVNQVLRETTETPDMSDLIKEIRAGNAVALTGAGFSLPAGLLSWANLLNSLLDSASSTDSLDDKQVLYIKELIATGTADSFDQAAQRLEDVLGVDRMQKEIGELLAINIDNLPRQMQRRIRIFLDIPWRVVLTTNYDMCHRGPTPQCSDVGSSYQRALRTGVSSIGYHLTQLDPSVPVIKLHGCVERGNIVFTRSGYRQLLYKSSGYRIFLQSMMASHTLVSLGHSGTDVYLNEMNSELLSMFGKSDLPLRYSIEPVSNGRANFARSYEGLNFLSWNKDRYGWGVFDDMLEHLQNATSPRARMRSMLRGKRILLVESQYASPLGWELIELASLLVSILPSVNVHLICPDNFKEAVSSAEGNVAPYDVVLIVYEKQSTQAILDSTIKHLPIAVVESNCSGNARGISTLRGFADVIASKEDASEFLFRFFERGVDLA